ncbi:MAG: hypothetical protein HKN07_09340 [Acidimicrobiia bacterium]|nr:hypothetical protein [Acidimicrobiia bacterium]
MFRHRTMVATVALAMVVQSCSWFTDGSDTTTTDITTDVAGVSITAASTSTTSTTTRPCLAVPEASGDRDRVGRIGEFFGQRGEADCAELFGGEPLQAGAVLATDDTGSFVFSMDKVIDRCQVQLGSNLVVHPADHVVLEVRGGEVICTIEGESVGAGQSLSDGYSIVVSGHEVIPIGPMVTMQMIVGDDNSIEVTVTDGLVRIEPEGLTCRSLIGEGQSAEVSSDQFDLSSLSSELLDFEAFGNVGAPYEPAIPGTELLPGISSLISSDDVAVVLDGELLNPDNQVHLELFPTLEVITGSVLALEGVGQINIVEDLPLIVAPDLEFTPQPVIIGDFLLEPLPLLDAVDLGQALETPVATPAYWDLLVDPNGQRWTLAFDASDSGLAESLQSMLTAEVISGAYGAYYREAFDVEPVFDLALPGLLEGEVSCLGG